MILLVAGREAIRVEERGREFVEQFAKKYDPQRLNIEFLGVGLAFSRVREALFSAPFLAEKRMVVLSSFLSGATKAEVEQWAEMLKGVPESTVAVILESDIREEKELAWLSDIGDKVRIYWLKNLEERELQGWLRERAQRGGLKLSERAWKVFFEAVGGDLTRASMEIAKLSAFSGGLEVTEADVRLLVSSGVDDEGPFAFSNALAGKTSEALGALQRERVRGAAEFLLFGTLVRTARIRLQIKAVLRQPVGDGARELGLHPFVFKKESGAIGKRQLAGLAAILAKGLGLDRLLKRGLSPTLAVDRLAVYVLKDK
jgi:DNA polymerase III delta subunit